MCLHFSRLEALGAMSGVCLLAAEINSKERKITPGIVFSSEPGSGLEGDPHCRFLGSCSRFSWGPWGRPRWLVERRVSTLPHLASLCSSALGLETIRNGRTLWLLGSSLAWWGVGVCLTRPEGVGFSPTSVSAQRCEVAVCPPRQPQAYEAVYLAVPGAE